MKIEDYEKYHQSGGSYIIPTEIFNELFNDYESFKQENQQLKNRDLIIAMELEKLQNNWKEIKDWLVEMINEIKTNDIYDRTEYECTQIATLESTLAKVEDIESRKY